MEQGHRLEIVLALTAEAIATLSLAVFLACIVRWTPRLGQEQTDRRATRSSVTPTGSGS